MKILFIENREKTLFWEQVAVRLRALGHDIDWLIQNPLFQPTAKRWNTRVHVIAFPKRAVQELASDASVLSVYPQMVTDRGREFFGAGAGHYAHYKSEIYRILDGIAPDIVIGESTLFHELMAIEWCRQAGVPFVQPISNRYPSGRFSLMGFDSQDPLIESGESWPQAQARELATRIATSTEIPFYMRIPPWPERMQRKSVWAATRCRVLAARLLGETFNTPSVGTKLSLQRSVKNNVARWRRIERSPMHPSRTLLYPMQLQPEANIDVWGRPFHDQPGVIQDMLRALPAQGFEIAVKANPKAQHELSDDLFDLAASDPRVCLLPFDMKMPEALALTNGAVTVTGTIGLEAICGKGRALSLRHPIIEKEFPEFHAPTPFDAATRLMQDPASGLGNVELGTRLIHRFVNQSFPGLVADPVGYPECVEPQNVLLVARAIERLTSTVYAPA